MTALAPLARAMVLSFYRVSWICAGSRGPRELTEVFRGGGDVSRMRPLGGSKSAEMNGAAAHNDLCAPKTGLTAERNAFVSRGIRRKSAGILHVLRCRRGPQISNSVVVRVPVRVIELAARPDTVDKKPSQLVCLIAATVDRDPAMATA